MAETASHTRRQVVWSLLGYVFPAFSSLFLTPYVVRGLGESRYGLFLLAMTTIGFLSVLELGLASAAVHELSHARASDDKLRARQIFATVVCVFSVLAVVGAAALLLGVDLAIDRVFKIKAGEEAEARLCLQMAAVGLFFNLAVVPFVSFVRAAERFDLQSKVGMVVTIFATLGTFWRGRAGDLIGALGFQLAGSLATAVALAVIVWRLDPDRARPTSPSLSVLRSLWNFASYQLLSRISGAIGQEIGKFVLAGRFGTAELTWFSVPFSMLQKVQRLLATASGILFPRIARLSGAGDKEAIQRTYRQAQKALIPVAMAMTLPLGAGAYPFLAAWISPEFADRAWQPMVVSAIAFGVSGAGVGFVQVLLGLGDSRSVFFIEVTHVILNTSLLLPLTGMLGVTGAAAAYLAGWLALAVGQVAVRRELGPEASRGIGRVVAFTVAIATPVGVAVHFAAAKVMWLGVLGPLAVCGFGTLAILGSLALSPWVFGDDRAVADELRGAPGRLLKRLRPA